jgi:hypothetical protein
VVGGGEQRSVRQLEEWVRRKVEGHAGRAREWLARPGETKGLLQKGSFGGSSFSLMTTQVRLSNKLLGRSPFLPSKICRIFSWARRFGGLLAASGGEPVGAAAITDSRRGNAWNTSSFVGVLWPGFVIRLLSNDSSDLVFLPEAGAQCISSARWDLCAGAPGNRRPYRGVPLVRRSNRRW